MSGYALHFLHAWLDSFTGSFNYALTTHDWDKIRSLVVVNALLSIENTFIVAVIAHRLPRAERYTAILIGLVFAAACRAFILFPASNLFTYEAFGVPVVKLLGAAFLVYTALRGLLTSPKEETAARWGHVILRIVIVDIVLSFDNMIGMLALTQDYHAIVIGTWVSMLIIALAARFNLFLVEHFPSLKHIGYMLVGIIGLAMFAEEAWRLDAPFGLTVSHFTMGTGIFTAIAGGFVAIGLIFDLLFHHPVPKEKRAP